MIDKSTDATDIAQLAIFIGDTDNKYNVTEEMSLMPLQDTTKSLDLYEAVKITLKWFSLTLVNISGIGTDGTPVIVVKKQGLIKLIEDDAITISSSCLMKCHCIVHDKNLCVKPLKMGSVMQIVIKAVNFV